MSYFKIINNWNYLPGGGAYITAGGSLTIDGTDITGNTSEEDGGGVYVSKGAFDITSGSITGNKAVNGGGVYVKNGGTFPVEDEVYVTVNTASGDGNQITRE